MSEDDPDTLRERVRELEQTAADLRETVEQLQQRRGPSRRDLLKVGSGGLLGAGLLASSQPVSAAPASADTSAGQVGVAGDPEDIVLDQAFDPGGDEILNVDDSGGINAQFGRPWYFDSVTLGGNLDADNNDLNNVGSLGVEQGVIDNLTLTQSSIGDVATHEGDQVSVSASSWETIFDFASAVNCLGGVIINNAAVLFDIRITWDDDSTDTIRAMGRSVDSSGSDKYTNYPVPPIADVKKLEFENPAANPQVFGWGVTTI